MSPENVNTRIELGAILFDCGRREEAIKAFDDAIQVDSSKVEIYTNKGLALKKMDRSDEAIACYR